MTPNNLIIGFVPLLDSATLVAAVEKGFTREQGLDVTLVRETSWANIRDRVVVGHFDAAHMLGPMAVASSLGIGHLTVPMVAVFSMGLGGNAITVSRTLWVKMLEHGAVAGADPGVQGAALKRVVAQRASQGAEPLTFAMVYPFSCHNYELRYWLAACGVDPDRDVRLVVIPPPFLADAMREGQVDGFCVGEPWNSIAVETGVGYIVNTTSQIWRLSPEKVLGCRADWARRHPEQLGALIRALYRASQWCEEPAHHAELAQLLAQPRFVGAPVDILRRALGGQLRFTPGGETRYINDFLLFNRQAATFPWASHALWFYSQMVRWQQIEPSEKALQAARAAYRPDLYRAALEALEVQAPLSDLKVERSTAALATGRGGPEFGAEGFFDGRSFEPADIAAYIDSFKA